MPRDTRRTATSGPDDRCDRSAGMAQLGREGRASSEKDVSRLADETCAAIKKIESYPASLRSEVTLAFDAIRSPGHATAASRRH